MSATKPSRWSAALLAVLFFAAWAIRAEHGWHNHSEAASHVHCDYDHHGASPHFHAGIAELDDCPVCTFVLAFALLTPPISLAEHVEIFVPGNIPLPCIQHLPSGIRDVTMRRGPPVV